MRIALGSDEVTELTDAVIAALREAGHEVELHGPPAGGDQEFQLALGGRAVGRALIERARSGAEGVDGPRGMLIEEIDGITPASHPLTPYKSKSCRPRTSNSHRAS